jgi:hypothetical protein
MALSIYVENVNDNRIRSKIDLLELISIIYVVGFLK